MIPAQLPGNDLVRMRGGGAAPIGASLADLWGCAVCAAFVVAPSNHSPATSVPAPPPASPCLSRPGPAGSDIENLAQPPPPTPPPPPSRAQTAPGPVKVGAVLNRRQGGVRGVPVSSPPGRRARLRFPGTSGSSAEAREELRRRLLGLIEDNRVMIFSKSYCPHSTRVGGAGGVRGQARLGWGGGSLGEAGSSGALLVLPPASPDLQPPRCGFCPRTHSWEAELSLGRPGLGPVPKVVTRIQGRGPLLRLFGTAGQAATGPAARATPTAYTSPTCFGTATCGVNLSSTPSWLLA